MLHKRIIILLGLILIFVVAISMIKPKLKFLSKTTSTETADTVLPEEELTGTFVDGLLGDFVFYRDDGFHHVSLPSRKATQIAGMGEGLISKFPHIRPAWSSDGKQFAMAADSGSMVVVNYDTGDLIKRIALEPNLDLSKETLLSFSPDNVYLLVKQNLNSDTSTLRFYEISSNKLVAQKQSCLPVGFWMLRQFIYVTTCREGEEERIIAFEPLIESAIYEVPNGKGYTLINEFDSDNLLVLNKTKPGKLSLLGKFTSLDSKSFSGLGSIEAFADLSKALASKIEAQKQTEKIDDLVISPNGSYAIYHTQKGLWIISLPLESDPYFLFEGDIPSIRPL